MGPSERYDALVIGAGAAGLAAAQRLTAAGLSVILVEARDRVGGRIHTLQLPGWTQPIEAGAEFVHGDPEGTWDLIRGAGLATRPVNEVNQQLVEGRSQPFEFDCVWDHVFRRLERAARDDLSFSEFLRQECADLTPQETAQATAYVEGFHAADSQLINTCWLLEADRASGQGGDAAAHRIQNGYDGILKNLLEPIRAADAGIRLNTVVESIHWQSGNVEVLVRERSESSTQSICARCAVITLPLGVLQLAPGSMGGVTFVPEVPQIRAACRGLRMGPVIKLFLRFREAFWNSGDRQTPGFFHVSGSPFPTWWTTNLTSVPILTGWAGGPAAERLAGMESERIVERALSSLTRSFALEQSLLTKLLEAQHLVDWQQDPWARGAYSYVTVGAMNAPHRLAEPIAGTLFFAGEATHDRLGGTVAGALASGYRAADQILSAGRSWTRA